MLKSVFFKLWIGDFVRIAAIVFASVFVPGFIVATDNEVQRKDVNPPDNVPVSDVFGAWQRREARVRSCDLSGMRRLQSLTRQSRNQEGCRCRPAIERIARNWSGRPHAVGDRRHRSYGFLFSGRRPGPRARQMARLEPRSRLGPRPRSTGRWAKTAPSRQNGVC